MPLEVKPIHTHNKNTKKGYYSMKLYEHQKTKENFVDCKTCKYYKEENEVAECLLKKEELPRGLGPLTVICEEHRDE